VCIAGSILGLLAAAGGAVIYNSRAPSPATTKIRVAVGGDDSDESRIVNPGYLGIEACAACHAERVAEFRETNHSRTFRVPESDGMPAGFAPGRGNYQTQDQSLRFEMTRSGNGFFQSSIRTTPAGEERSTSRIDLVLGAGGKADEVYLTWHDDRLFELPMAWLYTFDRWGCSHINPYGSGDFGRDSTLRCMECHNTWFAHVPGTRNQYRPDSFIRGVTCENCHGPGREHVAFHAAERQADSGRAIVKPAGLTRDRQLDLCTQCHSNALRHKGPALSYRPGEPLEDHYRTLIAPRYTEDDHVANQIKYLRQSRCFQTSEMTCTTCHNPHRPESRTVTGVESCRKCHRDADCREQPRLPAAVRENCAGCHMPGYIKINVNFEVEDDNYVPPIRRTEHRIAIHPRARQEVLLEWHRQQSDPQNVAEARHLTQSLVDDWLAEAESCRRDYRLMGAIAALREAYRLDPEPGTREKIREAVELKARRDRGLANADRFVAEHQYPQAIEILNAVLRVKPDDPVVHGKLGTALAAIGRNELAIEHWEVVAKYDPDDPYGFAMLGWLAYLQNRLEESVEAYRRADEVDPFNARINYHWGLALSNLGRWDEAAECFRHVLAIDPRHAGGQQGLAQALRNQDQMVNQAQGRRGP
jgi:tetratricopeptide (TPR) repeat protein